MSAISAFRQDTLQSAAGATGNGTAIGVQGYNTIVFQVVISNTATVTFEATVDGSNWIAIQTTNVNDGSTGSTATSSGMYRAVVSGFLQVRARISAFTSGTVTVTSMLTVGGGSGGGGGLTVSDIAIGAVELKDGTTDARATIKVDNAAAGTPSPIPVGGKYNSSAPTYDDGDQVTTQYDVNGNLKVTNATLLAGEDLTNNVLKVEQRFSGTKVTADTAVKSGSGFLHALTFSPNDATPTAGSIIVYDNTAESGTELFNWNVAATAFLPFTVILDVTFSTGLYIGFTTTNDVNVTPSYR